LGLCNSWFVCLSVEQAHKIWTVDDRCRKKETERSASAHSVTALAITRQYGKLGTDDAHDVRHSLKFGAPILRRVAPPMSQRILLSPPKKRGGCTRGLSATPASFFRSEVVSADWLGSRRAWRMFSNSQEVNINFKSNGNVFAMLFHVLYFCFVLALFPHSIKQHRQTDRQTKRESSFFFFGI
jgi:hypothetical protein